MKFSKAMLHLAGAEKGTEVMFQFDEVISETQDESEALAELRKEAADGEVMQDGKCIPEYCLLVVSDPPFNGRFVFPQAPKGNKEHFWTFSVQGKEIVFEQKYGIGRIDQIHFEPINSSPANNTGGYACASGEADGCPCVMLISKDRQRQLVIACRENKVINSILSQICPAGREFGSSFDLRTLSKIPAFENHVRQWDRIRNEIESILVKVKTTRQAVNALAKYGRYLDEFEHRDLLDPASRRSKAE